MTQTLKALQSISSPPPAQAEEIVNINSLMLDGFAVYAYIDSLSTGLTWAYAAGFYGGFTVAAGTLTLTASNTNYISVKLADGTISVATTTTNWNDPNYVRVYQVVTGTSAVTGTPVDYRFGQNGIFGPGTPSASNLAFVGIPQNSQSTAYTLVLSDANKHIYHPSADTTARTWTIPANSSVAYPIGTAITFVNDHGAGIITIAITTDTLRFAGAGTTGSRTLAADGNATALKITSTSWQIVGTGLT